MGGCLRACLPKGGKTKKPTRTCHWVPQNLNKREGPCQKGQLLNWNVFTFRGRGGWEPVLAQGGGLSPGRKGPEKENTSVRGGGRVGGFPTHISGVDEGRA